MTAAVDLAEILRAAPADIRSTLRRHARLARHDHAPIRVVAGSRPPHETGEGFFYTTPSGKTRVHHPNAYKWRTLYHPSQRHVSVGAAWLTRWLSRSPSYRHLLTMESAL